MRTHVHSPRDIGTRIEYQLNKTLCSIYSLLTLQPVCVLNKLTYYTIVQRAISTTSLVLFCTTIRATTKTTSEQSVLWMALQFDRKLYSTKALLPRGSTEIAFIVCRNIKGSNCCCCCWLHTSVGSPATATYRRRAENNKMYNQILIDVHFIHKIIVVGTSCSI